MWIVLSLLGAVLSASLVDGQSLPCPLECYCSLTRNGDFKADCSDRDLNQLPQGLDPQTQILDLSNNKFEKIPEEISTIIFYLEELNLSGNKIKRLSSNSLVNLTSLSRLNLSSNEISKWEDINPNTVLLPAINLNKLTLSRNPLNEFSNVKSSQILISESLEELILNRCGITGIFGKSPVSGLSALHHLSMAHNPIKRFQKFVSSTIRSLDLSHCELVYIGPQELNYLPSLTHLTLSNNYRLSLSSEEPLTSESLRSIDISYCNMDKVSLSGFPNLEEAHIKGNMLRHLFAGDFINNLLLTHLDLSSNGISHINKNAFDGLTSLKLLNLSVNVIPSINEETFMKTPNLTELILFRNYISNIGSLKSNSIQSIDMSFCEIQNLDANSLEGLKSLTEINLSRNLIGLIPDNLKSLSLEVLDLSYNRLSSINNNTFALLPELSRLYLSENRFTQTWKYYFFDRNPKLSTISLNDNTWRCDCHDNDMKYFFEYLTNAPPKIWNVNQLICHAPSNVSGRNWYEACFFTWNPELMSPNQRAMTYVLIFFGAFVVLSYAITLYRRWRKKKLRAVEEERERDAEAARDRLREQRMRREQEHQRNAPDPRDLVSPPSYAEALLMPKLDGSFHSLSGVGLGQEKEKKSRRRAKRRTRSSGDLLEEERNSDRIRNRRRRSRIENSRDHGRDSPTEESRLTTHRSEGNLVVTVTTHMHESDF